MLGEREGGGITEMCVSGITVDKVYSRREMSADISCFKGNHAAVVHRKLGDLCLENSRR